MVAPITPIDDLSDVVSELATGEYTVTRRTQANMVNGRRQSPTTTTLTVRASVQPMTGLKVDRLSEGKRNSETVVMFTTAELKSSQGSNEPDLVAIDGATFEVSSCERWNLAGNFWRSVLTRQT